MILNDSSSAASAGSSKLHGKHEKKTSHMSDTVVLLSTYIMTIQASPASSALRSSLNSTKKPVSVSVVPASYMPRLWRYVTNSNWIQNELIWQDRFQVEQRTPYYGLVLARPAHSRFATCKQNGWASSNYLQYQDSATETRHPIGLYSRYVDGLHIHSWWSSWPYTTLPSANPDPTNNIVIGYNNKRCWPGDCRMRLIKHDVNLVSGTLNKDCRDLLRQLNGRIHSSASTLKTTIRRVLTKIRTMSGLWRTVFLEGCGMGSD